MKQAMRWATLVVAGLLMAGCGSDAGAPVGKPGNAPGSESVENIPLVARLIVMPVTKVEAATATRPAVPMTFRLTLVVSNVTSRVYQGEAPDAAVARFALTAGEEPLWSFPTTAAQVVTPVTIGPGQKVTYNAMVTVADMRPYVGKILTARAQFTPASLTTATTIPVN